MYPNQESKHVVTHIVRTLKNISIVSQYIQDCKFQNKCHTFENPRLKISILKFSFRVAKHCLEEMFVMWENINLVAFISCLLFEETSWGVICRKNRTGENVLSFFSDTFTSPEY